MRYFLEHALFAIRHGQWSCGFYYSKRKPMFGFYHMYYDGYWNAFHLGPFYIEVNY